MTGALSVGLSSDLSRCLGKSRRAWRASVGLASFDGQYVFFVECEKCVKTHRLCVFHVKACLPPEAWTHAAYYWEPRLDFVQ